MATTSRKTGFTLTELTVAIAFFSILLLTIATVTINMTKNYHKGLSLKSINTIGLGLIDEFSSAVSESPVFDAESLCKTLGNIGDKTTVLDENGDPTRDGAGNIIYEYINGENGADRCMNDHAKEFIHQQFEEEITVEKNTVQNDKDLPTGGVFCTGKYSYVWNTGYVISQDETNHSMTSYFYSGGTRLGDGFRLRKFYDTGRSFCISNFPHDNNGQQIYPNSTYEVSLNNMVDDSVFASELIHNSDIAIYSMTINPPTVNEQSGRSLYTGSFVLGSITGDIEINGNNSGCSLEDVSSFDVEFCATNKFNFAMRAMGGNSGN